jgi:hypothetical protein
MYLVEYDGVCLCAWHNKSDIHSSLEAVWWSVVVGIRQWVYCTKVKPQNSMLEYLNQNSSYSSKIWRVCAASASCSYVPSIAWENQYIPWYPRVRTKTSKTHSTTTVRWQKVSGLAGNRTLDLPHAKGAHYPCATSPTIFEYKRFGICSGNIGYISYPCQ